MSYFLFIVDVSIFAAQRLNSPIPATNKIVCFSSNFIEYISYNTIYFKMKTYNPQDNYLNFSLNYI